MSIHPAVWISALGSIVAALGLLAGVARALVRYVKVAERNAGTIEGLVRDVGDIKVNTSTITYTSKELGELTGQVTQLEAMAHDHDTRLAVVEALYADAEKDAAAEARESKS